MKSLKDFAQHYDLDPASPAAKADYARYRDGLLLARSLFDDLDDALEQPDQAEPGPGPGPRSRGPGL